jgi:uncharacterized coiled-coil protein SlyX
MPFNSIPITVKDSASADKSLIAYNDGTSSAFAHPVLDSAGAIIDPATEAKQDDVITALADILAAVAPNATEAKQDTVITALADILAAVAPNATEAKQDTVITALADILAAVAPNATEAKQDALIAKVPALDNDKTPVIPSMTSGGNIEKATNVDGTTYEAFASQACKQLTISNQSGVAIEFQQGGSGVAFPIPNGIMLTIFGITNANQIAIRRTDTSATPVTIPARWEG